MTRLVDLIQRNGNLSRSFFSGPSGNAQILVADAVCEFFFAGTAQEHWDLRFDFPQCVPTDADVFVEMRRPSRIISARHGTMPAASLPRSWGWKLDTLATASSGGQDEATRRRRADQQQLRALARTGALDASAVERARRSATPLAASFDLPYRERAYFSASARASGTVLSAAESAVGRRTTPTWLVTASLIVESSGRASVPIATVQLEFDASSTIMSPPCLQILSDAGRSAAALPFVESEVWSLFYPALLALSFWNRGRARLRNVPAHQCSVAHQVLELVR